MEIATPRGYDSPFFPTEWLYVGEKFHKLHTDHRIMKSKQLLCLCRCPVVMI